MNEKTKLNSNMQYPKFKVNVYCATFQHAKYITDAMNGFTMQQTDFPFVCTIIDDASTDGEQDVIKQYVEEHFDLSEDGVAYKKETDYAHIIYARHKTNKNCYFAVLFLKENHYSQKKDRISYLKEWRENVDYIAMCEGDDYWIDPLKLQKQVKFLDENKEFSLCGTNGIVITEQCLNRPKYFNNIAHSREITFKEIVNYWTMPTASLLYRYEIIENYPNWTKNIISGDQTLLLMSTRFGRIYCFSDITCFYRKLAGESILHNLLAGKELFFLKNLRSLYEHFLEDYGNENTRGILTEKILSLKKAYTMINRKKKIAFVYRFANMILKPIKDILRQKINDRSIKVKLD